MVRKRRMQGSKQVLRTWTLTVQGLQELARAADGSREA
jgi:hypothetical protein